MTTEALQKQVVVQADPGSMLLCVQLDPFDVLTYNDLGGKRSLVGHHFWELVHTHFAAIHQIQSL